jgi:Fe-S cluster biosynthesis and repair protein YggX/cytochrome c-type biogenesis protein CcmH/NrfG
MTESNPRIEQFRKMANDDPGNPMGHFSLGRELLAAEDPAGAVAPLKRVLELDPNISKVYQLLATAQLKLQKAGEAAETLQQGVRIAHERGDMMPKNEMIKMLQELGASVPELQSKAPAQAVGEGQVVCSRCGQVKPKMAHPPFSNAQGKQIQEKVCVDCWREWIGMGTKVINELRLPLADPQAQKVFDQHMKEFLNLE